MDDIRSFLFGHAVPFIDGPVHNVLHDAEDLAPDLRGAFASALDAGAYSDLRLNTVIVTKISATGIAMPTAAENAILLSDSIITAGKMMIADS